MAADEDEPTVEMPALDENNGMANALIFDRVYLGELSEIPRVRAGLDEWLSRCCPASVRDDAILVVSEMAANAVLHSRSRDLFFSVRGFRHSDHIMVETEDLGGVWLAPVDDQRPHGLDIITGLASDWGTRDFPGGRDVWARIDLP